VNVAAVKRWNGSSWVDVPLPGGGSGDLSATVSSSNVAVIEHDPSPSAPVAKTLVAGPVTVTATGGSGAGPTYQWTAVGGPVGGEITSPTSATTSFVATVYNNDPRTALFRCRVTRGSETVDVFVEVTWGYHRGPIP
jgi:hypothetical protein